MEWPVEVEARSGEGEAREEERMQEDARLEFVRPERSACRKMSGWS